MSEKKGYDKDMCFFLESFRDHPMEVDGSPLGGLVWFSFFLWLENPTFFFSTSIP